MQQARSHVESVNLPKSIDIFPSESTNLDQDSHIEDISDQLLKENLVLEPAGCLKINYVEISSYEDGVQVEAMSSKCQKVSIPKWRKTTIFNHALLSQLTSQDLANKYPNLSLHTTFCLWKMFFTDELIKKIMFLTNLYAKKQK